MSEQLIHLSQIFIKSFLIDNVVFMQFLALCSYLGMSSDVKQSIGMGVAVTFVTLLATAVCFPLFALLKFFDVDFLQILVFILVIAALVQLVEFFLKKNLPALYLAMGIYLPLITTNCAILAVTLNMVTKEYNFAESMVYALGPGLHARPRPPRRGAGADSELAHPEILEGRAHPLRDDRPPRGRIHGLREHDQVGRR